MSHSTKIPLDLFQVLEEEFVTLHGTPAPDDAQTVNLADAANPGEFRSVISTLDWSFHPSHIKNPTSLALDLVSIWDARNDAAKSRAVFDVNADESAQNNLLLYMCNRLGPEVRAAIDDGLRGQSDLQKVLADALNTLLEDPDLFDEARFTYHRLSTKSQALVTSPLTQAKSIDKEDV